MRTVVIIAIMFVCSSNNYAAFHLSVGLLQAYYQYTRVLTPLQLVGEFQYQPVLCVGY